MKGHNKRKGKKSELIKIPAVPPGLSHQVNQGRGPKKDINMNLFAAKVAVTSLLEYGFVISECVDKVVALEEQQARAAGSFWGNLFNTAPKNKRTRAKITAAHRELDKFVSGYEYGEIQLKNLAVKLTARGYQLPKLDLPWRQYRLSPSFRTNRITGLPTSVVPIFKNLPDSSIALVSAQNYNKALDKIVAYEVSQIDSRASTAQNNLLGQPRETTTGCTRI